MNPLSLVERYGKNSNSFMTLYPGFEYFESPLPGVEGVVPYIDTKNAWIVGAEPVCAEENQIKLLEEFAQAASAAGKRTLLIPADLAFAERAEQAGFHAILVGSEPTFLLDRYPETGTTLLDVIPAAKALASKGAEVREFKSADLTEERRSEFDEMTRAWLKSRKTAALGFLNQVRPWLHADKKKYFSVELEGKTLAFLAAIPFKSGEGWYLIDTIRREESVPGTTELLLLQAMRLLQEQGAREITFGVAPLSGIESADKITTAHYKRHRILYGVLHFIFEHGNQFYNFKPLFAYKMKFKPTVVRPVFLLYRGKGKSTGLSVKDMVSISQAWLPHGMAHATGVGMMKQISRLSITGLIKSQLRPGTVVRSVPPSLLRLVFRCRMTVALLILSPFLMTNALHLILAVPALVIFTGGLEYLAGSSLAALCFFIPAALSVPIAALGGHLSLGVLGTAGGLYWFLRNGKGLLGVLAVGSLGWVFSASSASPDWIQLNHLAAVLAGVLIGKIRLRA